MAKLFTWGGNWSGRLGDNTTNDSSSPIQIGDTDNWKVVYAGYSSFAIKEDGTMWAWGDDYGGHLGRLTDNDDVSSPVQIGLNSTWSDVKSGGYHSLALKSDNTLWSWGVNYNGTLGTNDTADKSSPVQIGTDSDWASFATGEGFCGAIKSGGTLWMWGNNYDGQFGNDNTGDLFSSPVQIGSDTNWQELVFSRYSCAGLKKNGSLYTWGQNYDGCLGHNDTVDLSSPVQVGNDTNWKQIAFSVENNPTHMLALKNDGSIWAWGSNNNGQLGDETTIDRSSPIQVGTDTNWTYVATGYSTSYGIKNDGSLWAWGANYSGQFFGDDGASGNTSSPIQILTDKVGWTSISGAYHLMGLFATNVVPTKSCSNLSCTTSAFKCYVGTTQSCACAKWKFYTAQCTRIQQALGICSGTSGAYVPAIVVCNQKLF